MIGTRLIASAMIASLIMGCTTFKAAEQANADASKAVKAAATQTKAEREVKSPKVLYSEGAWLGSKAVPFKEARNKLPPAFYKNWYFHNTNRPGPDGFADIIATTTSIPLRVATDVYGSGAAQSSGDSKVKPSGPMNFDIGPDQQSTLIAMLDTVAARTGNSWRYSDGQIELYRYETRTFQIRTLPGNTSLSLTGGETKKGASSGGQGAAGSGAGQADSGGENKVVMDSEKLSAFDAIASQVETMLSPGRKPIKSAATGTISVTDVPMVLDQVAKLVERENARLSRQVHIRFQVWSVNASQSAQYGINWRTVFAQLAGEHKLSISSAANTVTAGAANLDFGILKKEVSAEAVLSAVSTQGDAHHVRSPSILAMNNQPTVLDIVKDNGYIASLTTTQTVNVGTTTSLIPGNVTTGFSLQVLPHILDNDEVILRYSIKESELDGPIKQHGSGTTIIQTVDVARRNVVQQASLKNGETLVLTGFEGITGARNDSGLLPNGNLLGGGTNTASHTKDEMIIMITPYIVGGAS